MPTRIAADAISAKVSALGTGPSEVVANTSGSTSIYRVVVGSVATRREAEQLLAQLQARGQTGFVRVRGELDPQQLSLELYATTTPLLFGHPVRIAAQGASTASLSLATRQTIGQLLTASTTSPQTINEMANLLSQISDDEPAKCSVTVMFAKRYIAQNNPYLKNNIDFGPLRSTLLACATGTICSVDDDRIAARKLYARVLHYYERDCISAIRAYREIADEAARTDRNATLALMRMEIAAASFELVKAAGLDMAQLENYLISLFQDASALQNKFADSSTAEARQTRWTAARIGLMLSETMLWQKEWSAARGIAQGLIDTYGAFPECQDETAEAYSHLANVAAALHQPAECNAAADAAIAICEKKGRPIWGDPAEDVLWKAYLWKNCAAFDSRMSPEEFAKFKAIVRTKFAKHPLLDKYFPADASPAGAAQ